jgi:hypothetical protein
VEHVIFSLLAARPVNHSSEDITGFHWFRAANVLILVIVVVTVIVTVTDEQIVDAFLHLSALKLALLAM